MDERPRDHRSLEHRRDLRGLFARGRVAGDERRRGQHAALLSRRGSRTVTSPVRPLRTAIAGLYRNVVPDSTSWSPTAPSGRTSWCSTPWSRPATRSSPSCPPTSSSTGCGVVRSARSSACRLRPRAAYRPDLGRAARPDRRADPADRDQQPAQPDRVADRAGRAEAIAALAEDGGAYVLCDEAYRGLYIDERLPVPSGRRPQRAGD